MGTKVHKHPLGEAMKNSMIAARCMLISLIVCATLLVPAVAVPNPAEALGVTAAVAARLVCGSNGRCYVENGAQGYPGGVPYGAPCYHVRNVSYVGYGWNTGTYSWYRGTQCSKTKSRW